MTSFNKDHKQHTFNISEHCGHRFPADVTDLFISGMGCFDDLMHVFCLVSEEMNPCFINN